MLNAIVLRPLGYPDPGQQLSLHDTHGTNAPPGMVTRTVYFQAAPMLLA
ncbi:MAG: hypothetical protein ABI222_12650 [Opitutaceae bacterium]